MTYTLPAGYYGLQLHEEIEQEICNLTYQETAIVIHHIVNHLLGGTGTHEVRLERMQVTGQKIAFLRWLSDRLAFLHTVPVQEVATCQ